jgi:cytochrome bd-type quinol oxidase subunit 1
VQEYILPNYIMEVRQIFRRGIGSVSGTTASQFEPFASGYLNTYMLVAGRVGGLLNYELFAQYQELAMTMFGGYMNYTWNRVTKKLTLIRKIPYDNGTAVPLNALTASSLNSGATITITLQTPQTSITPNASI